MRVDEVKKRERRVQKKPNRRTGGVVDTNAVPPLPNPAEFAKEHEFPDPVEMEKRLLRARLSSRIFASTLQYSKAEVASQLEVFDTALCALLDGLESEPFFSSLAFAETGMENNDLLSLLQNCYESLKNNEDKLQANVVSLPNSSSGKRALPTNEKIYLRELKKIHIELTGKDRRVTFDPEAIEPDEIFKGLFFKFARDCFKLESINISDRALSSRITTMHNQIDEKNT